MKIKMLETVEDSHGYVSEDEAGKLSIKYDVRKLRKGEELEDIGPEWDARARNLIKLGKAEAV